MADRAKRSCGGNLRRRSRPAQRRSVCSRVVLEKVLGVTTASSSGLTSDPNTGLVAYPAGCIVVLLQPKKSKQSHILNASRKTFTALAFSQDGKYLVTGESGHMPCVRVWDVAERTQVAEVQCHKYGVACVAFSPNGTYIVSVGFQHDQTVNVWDWRKGAVIAFNKVSSRVLAVSFSEDSSYFVTAGNRHVKFWYLDATREQRVNSTVPLIGRSGLLGEQQNSLFCDLACGRGQSASSAYCITRSGLLCRFNRSRQLDSWVDLKTGSARCISVSEALIFCGCADGTVRVFSPQDLRYIATIHKPHHLGVDVTQGLQSGQMFPSHPEAEHPDTLALTFDPVTRHLTCVYNDHSVYVWDVRDVRNVGKVYSSLYHSGCVWNVEMYPELEDSCTACLPAGAFLTCSSDNTIRLWKSDSAGPNVYSHDLMKIVYVAEDTQHLQSNVGRPEGGAVDGKAGIRVLSISPDGQQLAAGDRCGNIRVFGLQFMDELLKIEAHDSEVLCLEFSPVETGLRLLASASRDRLIHVFNMDHSYSLEQTVDDHSASITAIKFMGVGPNVSMVSCGADKSIYFRQAEKCLEGLLFPRSHHVVEKTTLYDMDRDSSHTHVAVACQDRNIRVYDVKSGKMQRSFKGTFTEDGTLLKVQMDPSGTFLATSCSDKSIYIFDYESGERVATLIGHSEIVTGMRFSQDCRHLITVSGDSCVFVWRLDSQMTNTMMKKLSERRQRAGLRSIRIANKPHSIRRETYITVPVPGLQQALEEEDPKTPGRDVLSLDLPDHHLLQTNGRLPMWVRKLEAVGPTIPPPVQGDVGYQPRNRWAEQSDPRAVCSALETQSLQLDLLSPGSQHTEEEETQEEDPHFHPQSLDSLLDEDDDEEEEEEEEENGPDGEEPFGPEISCLEMGDLILYPANSTALSTAAEGEFDVKALCEMGEGPQHSIWGGVELSPDSACCVGSIEGGASGQEQPIDRDTDSLSQVSSTGSSGVEEDEQPETSLHQHFDTLANSLPSSERFDTDLRSLQPTQDSTFLNPRLSISARFLSRFGNRIRVQGSGALPRPAVPVEPVHPSQMCAESDTGTSTVAEERKEGDVAAMLKSRPQAAGKRSGRRHHRAPRSRHTVSLVGWKDTLREITNKVLSGHSENVSVVDPTLKPPPTSQDSTRPLHLSYMGTTVSSRAKLSGSSVGEGLAAASLDEQLDCDLDVGVALECKENLPPPASSSTLQKAPPLPSSPPGNHSARATLQLDLSGQKHPATSQKSWRRTTGDIASQSSLVTPTEMRSLGKEEQRRLSSIEESLTPRASPRPWTPNPDANTGPTDHLVDPDSAAPPAGVDPALLDYAGQPCPYTAAQADVAEEATSLQTCHQVICELQGSVARVLDLYRKLRVRPELPDQHMQMSVLQEAVVGVQAELASVCPLDPGSRPGASTVVDSPGRQLRDDRAVALLEKYSDLLLQMAEKKMELS
ncbi:WD repeat-containing protein 62 isoform X2 [Denticeps clupeoides]|uniref:WD repeat-containing protein 62 isoform X2 n=1 Tax=Denticeps clupeoides TaxID=299321 RepID=UPI0010A43161|nr:mitogen-activated protein kinase-binding protein 1-like isoform X2 [Denticeps clupeoides]